MSGQGAASGSGFPWNEDDVERAIGGGSLQVPPTVYFRSLPSQTPGQRSQQPQQRVGNPPFGGGSSGAQQLIRRKPVPPAPAPAPYIDNTADMAASPWRLDSLANYSKRFVATPTQADLLAGLGAGLLAAAGKPPSWWASFVIVNGAVGTAQGIHGLAHYARNPLLQRYYDVCPPDEDVLGAAYPGNRNYFARQIGYGAMDAAFATISLIGGAFHPEISYVANSLIHVRADLETLWGFIWACDRRLRRSDEAFLRKIGQELLVMKAARHSFRVVHATLPFGWTGTAVLWFLMGASVGRTVVATTIGGYIEGVAQHIHFKAYQEQGYLQRGIREVRLNSGGRIVVPGRGAGPDGIDVRGPYTHCVRTLFCADPWPYSDYEINRIIEDPTGWNAIAHRLAVL